MDKQCSSCGGFCGKYCQRENIKQETKDEPVAWISTGPARMIHWTSDKPAYGDDWVALYTTPQRTWVGLDTEEFKFIASKYLLNREVGLEYFQEEIETKLKERNT